MYASSIKNYLNEKSSSYSASNYHKNGNDNNDSVIAKMMNKKMNDFRDQI